MQYLENLFALAQQYLFESVMEPPMFALGFGDLLGDGYAAAGWLLIGLVQIAFLLAVIGPLERWRPIEPVTDREAVRTDIIYTLIHRLGLFGVALFFLVQPITNWLFGMLRVAGYGKFQLDQVWPSMTEVPFASSILYLIAFDFAQYWIHRAQHQFDWWWSLHSLHHSQRQLTMWSDDRNHLLDDVMRDTLLVVLAQVIGVGPGQFVALVAFTQLSESLQHANARVWFGQIGERLWISPRFHRLHHSVGIGHEAEGHKQLLINGRSPPLGGHNFGVLLPWWDMLFGTANFHAGYEPTGLRDQVEQGRDYGRGFWLQQWRGLQRLAGRA